MKTWAIVCFAFAALGFMVAAQNIAKEPKDDLSRVVGYAVGNLLVPIAALVGGLILWDKAAKHQKAKDEIVSAEIVDDRPKNPPA